MDEMKEMIDQLIKKYGLDERNALAMLQDIQRSCGYIPGEAMDLLALKLSVPFSRLYSMATFYKALSLKPRGKNLIRVCDGTACHIRSAPLLADAIERFLGIKPGETTQDGEFTLETVNCLGSCAIAPIMVVNGVYYGKVTLEKLKDIISNCGGTGNERCDLI